MRDKWEESSSVLWPSVVLKNYYFFYFAKLKTCRVSDRSTFYFSWWPRMTQKTKSVKEWKCLEGGTRTKFSAFLTLHKVPGAHPKDMFKVKSIHFSK